jgi:hypothetical protein
VTQNTVEVREGIHSGPILLLCLIATAIFVYLTFDRGFPTAVVIDGTHAKPVLMPNNVPVVEPVALTTVSLDRAKQINDAIRKRQSTLGASFSF